MIYIVCLLVGVGSGLWCSLKYDEVMQRIRQRRQWDAEFEAFMRTRWADQ